MRQTIGVDELMNDCLWCRVDLRLELVRRALMAECCRRWPRHSVADTLLAQTLNGFDATKPGIPLYVPGPPPLL
jgi:hypothetical protein